MSKKQDQQTRWRNKISQLVMLVALFLVVFMPNGECDVPYVFNRSITITNSGFQEYISASIDSCDADNNPLPYTVAIQSGPSHGYLMSAGINGFYYTPNMGYSGSDSFTYTATNRDGTSSLATVSITINGLAPPIVSAVSATVAYNSSNNMVVSIGGGGATSLSVALAPNHGTATSNGTSITYTPATGYSGSDSFTYTGRNSGGTSSPATVSITVSPPASPIAGAVSATVAYNSSNNSIPLNLSGGAATSIAVALPASHGTTTVSGTSITYTPTAGYSGTDSFSYTATNAGGTSSSATVSITVNPPAPPAAGAVSATVAYNSSNNSIPLNLSGGAATSVAIALPASHGTATVSGTSITYTPATGYSGSDSFTYTATNAGGTSSAATVSLTVTAAVPVANAVSATIGYNSSNNSIPLNLSGGAATSVAVASAPSHGTATVSGTSITYTPAAGYSGTDSFTYTATNAGGTSSSATVSLTVRDAPTPPVANGVSVTVAYNSSNNVIPLSISGGTATSVAVVSGPSHGTATASGTSIIYTPTTGYSGSDSFTYTATNSDGTSAVATVNIVVSHSDPSKDAEVKSILTTQAAMAQSLGTAQIGNFQNHLDILHSRQNSPSAQSQSFISQLLAQNTRPVPASSMSAGYQSTPSRRINILNLNLSGNATSQDSAWWSAGTMQFGHFDSEGGTVRSRNSTITVGHDQEVSPEITIGTALTWGRQNSDINANSSKATGTSIGMALYGSKHAKQGQYVDFLVGYQSLKFETERYIAATGEVAPSIRNGKQWYVSAAAGQEYRKQQQLFGVYAKLTKMRIYLDSAAERLSSGYALTYAAQTMDSLNFSLGARLERQYPTKIGLITAKLRTEFQHEFQNEGSTFVAYSNDLTNWYTVAPTDVGRDALNMEFGFDLAHSPSSKSSVMYTWNHYFHGYDYRYLSLQYTYRY